MKVPNYYKSSDRFNAGTDVIYNDESKLQYAPFIYATTESGDNGGDGEDDEEGEDIMVVHILQGDESTYLDKNWTEIKESLEGGKFVYLVDASDTDTKVLYIAFCEVDDGEYFINTRDLRSVSTPVIFKSSTATGVLTYVNLS